MSTTFLNAKTTTIIIAVVVFGFSLPLSARDSVALSEADLAIQWADDAEGLNQRALRENFPVLAAIIKKWHIPVPSDQINVFRIPNAILKPPEIVDPRATSIWEDFVRAREKRAEALFQLAVRSAQSHNIGPDFTQRSYQAIRLLSLVLRENPSHKGARIAGGWVQRNGLWVWPEVAQRIDKGEVWSETFGWLSRSHFNRYEDNKRYIRGMWVQASDKTDGPQRFDQSRIFFSDHWRIQSSASYKQTALLASEMEETFEIWRQVFGAFQLEPVGLERQFEGRAAPTTRRSFDAVLTSNRQQYIHEMGKLEPLISQTLGIYWNPSRTSWFFEGEDRTSTTVCHEATHQLFGEMRNTSPLAGERCGFWALEAAACFMESLQRTDFGWTVGGIENGRVPAARQRLLLDDYYVPLEQLTRLGRRDFQSRDDLPPLYSQISGLADFFMTGSNGQYREAFIEYLVRIYTGSANPDTLSRLCKADYESLDRQYRRHLSQ